MRRLLLVLALLATGVGVADAKGTAARPPGVPVVGQAQSITPITITNLSAAIQYTGQSWVNPANDLWNGIQTTRYNRSYEVFIENWKSNTISFQAQGIPGADGNITILYNGVLVTTVSINTTTAVPRWYTASGIPWNNGPPGVLAILGDFQERQGGAQLNSGADSAPLASYVLGVSLPPGAVVVKHTATTGIAAFGDSHMDGDANVPCSYYGWVGQLRREAEAHGWMVGYVGAGSSTLAGDGLDAHQTAQTIHQVWADMGATTKWFLMMRRPNDYAYYDVNGFTTSPTQYGTYLQTIQTDLDASDPGWRGFYTRIPQGTGWAANTGGWTLAQYWTATASAATANGRTNVTTLDGSLDVTGPYALDLSADFFEAPPGQVHMVQ